MTGDNQPTPVKSNFRDAQPSEITTGTSELNKNVSIHVMPETFRSQGHKSDSHKKTGLIILALGFLLILAIVGAGYYYFFVLSKKTDTALKDNEKTVENTKSNTEGQANSGDTSTTTASQAQNDVKEKYLKFRQEIDQSVSMDDYYVAIGNFTSQNYKDNWAAQYKKYQTLTDAEKIDFFNFLKNYIPTTPQMEKELSVKSSDQTKTILTATEPEAIEITMVYEQGGWKTDQETGLILTDSANEKVSIDDWLKKRVVVVEKPEATTTPAEIKLSPGIDEDNDGLTDLEEGILGTDPKKEDTDGDGYSDYKEFIGFYNPTGVGKFTDNKNIKELANSAFNYRIFYPASWSAEKIGGDESIMLKSKDNQFMQVISSANTNKEEIDEWYKRQFNVTEIMVNSVIEKRSADGKDVIWRGIKNQTGLVVYLTDTKKEFIYILTYNLGQSTRLDYINIFNNLVQSLEIIR